MVRAGVAPVETTMSLRLTALACLVATGCYLAPNDPSSDDPNSDASGLSGEGGNTGGTGSFDSTGTAGQSRGKLERGPLTIYWKQRDNWGSGACMDPTNSDDASCFFHSSKETGSTLG